MPDSSAEIARTQAATAGLSLMKALIDYSASGPLADAAKATHQWLIREGINEASFDACRKLAADRAYPNKHGLELQRGIDESDRSILTQLRKAPLQLVVSGSLGRLVGRLPDLAWMVTTFATLVNVHGPKITTDFLCSMILDQGGHEDGVRPKYEIQRRLITATIAKVAESIFINVSNVGHKLDELPPELADLHAHTLKHETFAAVVMGLTRESGDAIVKSTHFLKDLTLWLLFHFEGTLEVYVQTKLRFKEQRGSHTRHIRLMIELVCDLSSKIECDNMGYVGSVNASIWSGSSWTSFVKGEEWNLRQSRSYQRVKLYQIDRRCDKTLLNGSILTERQQKATLHTAKVVFRLLFSLPLVNDYNMSSLAFKVAKKATSEDKTIGELFHRIPYLARPAFQATVSSDPVIDWEAVSRDSPVKDSNDYTRAIKADRDCIVNWTPILADLLESAREECECRACSQKRVLSHCMGGCARKNVFMYFIALLVHGFCDAVGADDVSGDADDSLLLNSAVDLLLTVLEHRVIRWEGVFSITASAILGKNVSVSSNDSLSGRSAYAAAQHGSLVVMASWLDISEDLSLQRPFSLTISEGNIQGLTADFGILFCESSNIYRAPPDTPETESSVDQTISPSVSQIDECAAEVCTAIFMTGSQRYRLMTCVATGSRFAVVDPSMVMSASLSSLRTRCDHRGAAPDNATTAPCPVQVYNFEEAFTSWSKEFGLPPLALTTRLDSYLKLNTLLGLGRSAYICNEEQCCLSCVLSMIHPEEVGRRIVILAQRSPSELVRPGRSTV